MGNIVTFSPFNRVEGDLKIKVEIKDGVLIDARASGVMYRGFEKILKGSYPEDALVFTPRICGICSISHSIASSNALVAISEDFVPSRNGICARNICHAVENAMSHITQFYIYFAPDLLNKKYSGLELYPILADRLMPLKGASYKEIVAERKRFLEILGLIVGKWPHTLAIQPGGITHSLSVSDIARIRAVAAHFSSVIGKVLLGMSIEEYLGIKLVAEFETTFSETDVTGSDLALFYRFAVETGLMSLGKGPGRFISGGGYPQTGGSLYIPSGFWNDGKSAFAADKITESINYSFFDGPASCSRPMEDVSEPKIDKPGAYSWCKAPRYGGEVVEVGALGRQLISGDPLVTGFFNSFGSTVFTRVFARLHEAIKLLATIQHWAGELEAGENYYSKNLLKETASGAGITEAARGFLGHWISVEGGRIKNYQVITPTSWNASPRDEKGAPGAIEQALIGTPIEDEENYVQIDHIIRSYDPCLVCTVH